MGLPGGTCHAVEVAITSARLTACLTPDGKIRTAEEADREWAATTSTTRTPKHLRKPPAADESTPPGPPAGPTLADARMRHETARASVSELELRRLQGELVPLSEVRAEVAARYTVVRTRLLGVPARVKQRAPHLAAADVRLIDDFIREALEELADGVEGAVKEQSA